MLAFPVADVEDRCPAHGEGYDFCWVQKSLTPSVLILLAALFLAQFVARLVLVRIPAWRERVRDIGERRVGEEDTRPEPPYRSDPFLLAATWGEKKGPTDRRRPTIFERVPASVLATASPPAPARLSRVPTFCRHGRLLANCPICSKSEAPAERARPSPGAPRALRRRPRTPKASSGIKVRRVERAAEDGYDNELVPGLRATRRRRALRRRAGVLGRAAGGAGRRPARALRRGRVGRRPRGRRMAGLPDRATLRPGAAATPGRRSRRPARRALGDLDA